MTSLNSLLNRVLRHEADNAKAIKSKLEAALSANKDLQDQLAAYKEQGVIAEAQAAELEKATQTLTTRLNELEAMNAQPVTDDLAEEIKAATGEDAPAEIVNDSAIGTAELTADETVQAIAEILPIALEAEETEAEETEAEETEAEETEAEETEAEETEAEAGGATA